MSETSPPRSVLLVAACPAELARAIASAASAIVADLTLDAGSPDQRRASVAAWLGEQRTRDARPRLFVGVHDIESGSLEADIEALFPDVPDGLLLQGCRSGQDVQRLGVELAVREAEHDLADGRVGVLAVAACTAAAVLALNTLVAASPRLQGLIWDGDALAADLGLPLHDPTGKKPAPMAYARALTLLVAKAAGVPALEGTPHEADEAAIRIYAEGRRDGFAGALTRHVRQVPLIDAEYARPRDVSTVRTP